MKPRTIRMLAAAALASTIVALLAVGTNWRLALVAALAAGAITLTRLRYSVAVAVALLAVTLALAQTGRSAGSDDRDPPARTHHR